MGDPRSYGRAHALVQCGHIKYIADQYRDYALNYHYMGMEYLEKAQSLEGKKGYDGTRSEYIKKAQSQMDFAKGIMLDAVFLIRKYDRCIKSMVGTRRSTSFKI